jgi:LysM repeat protein
MIHPGDALAVPGAVNASPSRKSTYTVVAGDGWVAIARELGVHVDDLLAANAATKATMIHPGDVLNVPAAAA